MKRIITQFLLVLLTAVMLVSVSAVSVGAAADTEPVVMNFEYESKTAFDLASLFRKTNFTLSSNSGTTASGFGKVQEYFNDYNNISGELTPKELDSATNAIKLSYDADSSLKYNIMPAFKNSDELTLNHKYVRITYMAKNAGSLVMCNSDGTEVYEFETDAYSADMVFVTTAVAELSNDMITRLNKCEPITVGFDCATENAKFYIKEIAFYTSKKEAYSSDVVIMDFGYDGSVGKVDYQGANTGIYEYTTIDNTPVLNIMYDNTNYGAMHAMIEFNLRDDGGPTKEEFTAAHRYMRVTYMTDDYTRAELTLSNCGANNEYYVLSPDTSASNGEWVRTNACEISDVVNARFINPKHFSLDFNSTNFTTGHYIKEIAFFTSEEAAYGYYEDEPITYTTFTKMTFGDAGNAYVRHDDSNYGSSSYNSETDAIDIVHDDNGNHGDYMAKVRFRAAGSVKSDEKYMCVIYSANHPEGVEIATFKITNDGPGGTSNFILISDMTDTNGEFVVSDPILVPDDIITRFNSPSHCSLLIDNSAVGNNKNCVEGGTYSVNALYFFNDIEAAQEFADTYVYETPAPRVFKIKDTEISNYRIVIDDKAPDKIVASANSLQDKIELITGKELKIVRDTEDPTTYEILIGESSRPLSQTLLVNGGVSAGETDPFERYENLTYADYAKKYGFAIVDKTLVITGSSPLAIAVAVDLFADNALYLNAPTIPLEFSIGDSCRYFGIVNSLSANSRYASWLDNNNVANVDDPTEFIDNFATDRGYFTEENYADNFKISRGKLSASADISALTFIQVYEKNATASAEFTYTEANNDGKFGLMLRYTGVDAYVRAGYDFENKQWFISFREGEDFYEQICASKPAYLDLNETYKLSFVVYNNTATLYVNDMVLSADNIYHRTPGRPAIFSENVEVSVDNYKLSLDSGMGTILRNTTHTLLPVDSYLEGGSVVEFANGDLIYTHHSKTEFKSVDGGKTWNPVPTEETWTHHNGRPHYIRLDDGNLLSIAYYDDGIKDNTVDGFYSYTSTDEGKSWKKGEKICGPYFEYKYTAEDGTETTVLYDGKTSGYTETNAGNMNDKVTQGASGRIYYSQNYESAGDTYFPGDTTKRAVFCEFYYSDDNGANWTKSDTSSWEIAGNKSAYKFGECKLIEIEDWDNDDIVGDCVRVYCSWTDHGCITYADSEDGGATFGELKEMPNFRCARSSMQIAKDPYAENGTTYYMVWVNAFDYTIVESANMPRAALTLAKSTNGMDWEVLGDIWRWESNYMWNGGVFNHIVDPFITVTEDYILCGTGISEHTSDQKGDSSVHGAQRQHIWSIDRLTLEEFVPFSYDGKNSVGQDELTYFCRALANWNGYSMDTYADYKNSFDLNRDGKINSIDLIIFIRYSVGWDDYISDSEGYPALPFNTRSAN